MKHLRVITYNVHKCRGMDGRVSAVRIAGVLRELRGDIIGLQEVTGEQAECLSRELKMPYAMGENRQHQGCAYGNVLMSRWPIHDTHNYDLSVRGREQRGCLRADISVNGILLHVFNVHLGTSLLERREQGRKLIAPDLLAHSDFQSPRIVLGDFNEWTSGLATRLLREHLESADVRRHLRRSRTYPGFLPFLHLDHIYYDKALQLDKLCLYRTPKTVVASDHLPLVGDFSKT